MGKKQEAKEINATPTEPVAEAIMVPAEPPSNFQHQMANVNGINLHYVIGGKGEPLVLLHGFGQNWYMWNRLLPELSKHFTVIAPDLRGIGESDKPESGYDKKTMAVDIHEMVKQLGYEKINLVGHDIGMMVAYAYAAQFGNEVKKIALLDALLPGVEPVWQQLSTTVWHFGFFSRPVAGEVVAGKEEMFFKDFWTTVTPMKRPFSKDEEDEFIRAYSVKGSTTGSFHWFGDFQKDVIDNHEFMKHKLEMPMLAMGGEYFSAPFLAEHCRLVAEEVTEAKIKGSGHWVVQEQTEQVQKGLMDFFLKG
ncbi:alpha/beta hydrolase [Flagellimonas pelagia]|uniref:Alpha/beta hydrolase n=2 Tax=Flagellimonas pelagia TaxID=2306998 RepID=A0A3A1NH59_9FLAO|nr:alpha/beta hydrolase [Allomuricauda maritima]TXJ91178.1 alpha/beta hydrolase [Allomuricauda maritima]